MLHHVHEYSFKKSLMEIHPTSAAILTSWPPKANDGDFNWPKTFSHKSLYLEEMSRHRRTLFIFPLQLQLPFPSFSALLIFSSSFFAHPTPTNQLLDGAFWEIFAIRCSAHWSAALPSQEILYTFSKWFLFAGEKKCLINFGKGVVKVRGAFFFSPFILF